MTATGTTITLPDLGTSPDPAAPPGREPSPEISPVTTLTPARAGAGTGLAPVISSRSQPLDWRLIVTALAVFSTAVAGLYLLQDLLWRRSVTPVGPWHWVSLAGQVLWCLPVIAGVLGVAGMLVQRKAPPVDPSVPPLENLVVFRFMTRGTNPASLRSSLESVVAEMAALPLFGYRIEVFTEKSHPGLPARTQEFIIPRSYATDNGTLWKGRALQYALEHSELPQDAWILHCDEESHITRSLVWGVYCAVAEEEASGRHRVGQGRITYVNSLAEHPFLTMADSVRSGDDVGRFHLQNRVFGIPVWGYHGSFILVRQSVEELAGFDFGPDGSITEDAFWALATAGKGIRSRYVDGVMIEQSPERWTDFVRQRRRWYVGLVKTVRHAPAPLWLRLPLGTFTALWSVAWLGVLYTYLNYAAGWHTAPAVQAIGNISFASYILIYVIGLHAQLATADVCLTRQIRLYAGQVAGILAFSMLEAAGVFLAVIGPKRGFFVMPKRMTNGNSNY